jgi:hypothetical protein
VGSEVHDASVHAHRPGCAITFAWSIGSVILWAVGIFECDWVGQVPAGVMTGSLGAGILAVRLGGALAVAGTLLMLVAIVVGAELGWAVAMGLTGCERTDEGPALTLLLFGAPSAAFGYVIGWLLRRGGV